MPTKEQQRAKLIGLLKELFQLNQPDLDFGFYRIMHAKAKEVTEFLENDLLKIVEEAFGQVNEGRIGELRKAYEDAIADAKRFGAANPEETDPVKQAKAALDAAADTSRAEGEVYDHLYRFFERYYDGGDFLSRRYLTRETEGKAAPYAIPYNGEEVKLHWANADQYYIKTTEYFNNYRFDLAQAPEIVAKKGELFETEDLPPLPVEFRIVHGTEGEHGNIKATNGQKRYFILRAENPVSVENGHLIIRFEYRPDPEKPKGGTENKWQETRRNEAVTTIFEILENLEGAGEYARLFQTPVPTEKQKDRTLLAGYLGKYMARNTMDYFIHKDLESFLHRELDFYIKNEVMRLDDVESADRPKVEQYLDTLRVLRRIAQKVIDFLAQLEDFQKRLWLKKKFVVESNYCITLDRMPEEFYPEIAANTAQQEEWGRLFAIEEIKAENLGQPRYSKPLTVDFLKGNRFLVLDTQFFSKEFKERLLASTDDLDGNTDGLLIHSENFQALGLLQERYAQQVDCTYIDPPYNTDATPILYKNEYQSASWLSLIRDRLILGYALGNDGKSYTSIAIDDHELANLSKLIEALLPQVEIHRVIVVHYPGSGTGRSNVTRTHEYNLFLLPRGADILRGSAAESGQRERGFRRAGTGENNYRVGRPNSFYAVLVDPETREIRGFEPPPEPSRHDYPREATEDGYVRIYPIGENDSERCWSLSYESASDALEKGLLNCTPRMVITRTFLDEDRRNLLQSVWDGKQFNAVTYGTNLLTDILGTSGSFSYPKSVFTVANAIEAGTFESDDAMILDYFAGSGTAGHAVIDLNRDDDGNRKYVLVEMGDYFDTVLKPRIQKVIYSKDWKDGKPVSRDSGISHMFKYIRLESYEDCLNNLDFVEDETRDKLMAQNPQLREDYMLRYMLDVETRGSQSLLNIDGFKDPTAYKLKVKKPGSDEHEWRNVDLLETFNYLIGLRVEHIAALQVFTAEFKREPDPDLPEDQNTKLILDGKLKQDPDGPWWFRKVEGWIPADINHPNNGHKERVLIVWRKLTDDMEKDNLMLDEWFGANRISTRDFEFDTIYVNGSNNLPNLRQEGDTWKVRLIEEDFHKLMWDVEDV